MAEYVTGRQGNRVLLLVTRKMRCQQNESRKERLHQNESREERSRSQARAASGGRSPAPRHPRATARTIAAHRSARAAPRRAAPHRAAPHRTAPRRAASHLGAQHRTAAQPPRTAAHGAASQRSSAASAPACAALGGVAGGRRGELGGQTHGAQANMRRGNLQRAEKAQHAAQVGCHSHRRRGQASTRAHFRAATLNRATENLLFFDLRC